MNMKTSNIKRETSEHETNIKLEIRIPLLDRQHCYLSEYEYRQIQWAKMKQISQSEVLLVWWVACYKQQKFLVTWFKFAIKYKDKI